VTGPITGTPLVFKTRILAYKIDDSSTLYKCSIPDEIAYEQRRAQYRLELAAAGCAEASITKEGKMYSGKKVIFRNLAPLFDYTAVCQLRKPTALIMWLLSSPQRLRFNLKLKS
jgi:hypothetical protein